jgi:hypothetical protein
MTQFPEIAAGYGITALTLAGYAWRIVARTRKLAKAAEEERAPQ